MSLRYPSIIAFFRRRNAINSSAAIKPEAIDYMEMGWPNTNDSINKRFPFIETTPDGRYWLHIDKANLYGQKIVSDNKRIIKIVITFLIIYLVTLAAVIFYAISSKSY